MQRIILAILVINTLVAAAGAAMNFQLMRFLSAGQGLSLSSWMPGGCVGADCSTTTTNAEEYLFFPVEKIIISLPEGGREHYFVLDLVLQSESGTDKKKLQQVDPMVRNSAVAHLSSMTFPELRGKSISDLQQGLEQAIFSDFQTRQLAADFSHVLVSKLVVQ